MINYKSVDTFDYEWFKNIPIQSRKRGNQSTKTRFFYKDCICAFDIETTRIKEIEQSIMYIWQFQVDEYCTVIGRTWNEFILFIRNLGDCLKNDERLCIFVHNLSYEFQFLRGIYDFKTDEVFAIKSRKILKCMFGSKFEFRCSYLHSNMSLAQYTTKMKARHIKMCGKKFDYSKIRYPWTHLTKNEYKYSAYDVIGLVEAIKNEMKLDEDNLYTFPLTSTGYVRRDAKKAMRKVDHNYIPSILPDYNVYKLLREAFRGGNTHANRYFANKIVENVKSADRSSSYPDCQCNDIFPISKFQYEKNATIDDVIRLIRVRKKAVLFVLKISNVSLINEKWGCPYLAKDKCRNVKNGLFDNGRILSADYLETTITDIDFNIILSEYKWTSTEVGDVYSARYGKLPTPLIECTIGYYKNKTELKDVVGQEVFYTKQKNKLNAIYGMQAQNPVKHSILFQNGLFELDKKEDMKLLEENNRKAFMTYAWGVWVTCWARFRLEEGIRMAHNEENGVFFIYCDTDSVKYIGDINWTSYNEERKRKSIESGMFATDTKGVTHYGGVYENDGDYINFKTLGAKKYCYTDRKDRELHVTIAGVNKKEGAKELKKNGGIDSFKSGFKFIDGGGTESVYNDENYGYYKIDGHELYITSNVVIKESEYTLGITGEYERLLNGLEIL